MAKLQVWCAFRHGQKDNYVLIFLCFHFLLLDIICLKKKKKIKKLFLRKCKKKFKIVFFFNLLNLRLKVQQVTDI